jgi:O-antigen/teichoic acid export membrane protein
VLFGGLVTGTLLASSLGVLWFVQGQATLNTVLLLTVGSGLINILIAGWFLRRKMMSFPMTGAEGRIKVREMLNVSWPLLVASLTFYVLTQSGIWVVGAFRSTEEVAIYGAVIRLVLLLSMPLTMVSLVLTPLIAEMYARGEKRQLEHTIRTVATLVSIPALLMFVMFILLGGSILSLVYGDYYRAGATVLIVLSMGQLATFWSGACGHVLNMTGHQHAAMVITALSAIVCVAIALATVNNFGMLGVALATFAALVLQNVAMVIYSRKVIGIKPNVSLHVKLKRGKLFR